VNDCYWKYMQTGVYYKPYMATGTHILIVNAALGWLGHLHKNETVEE